VWVVVAPLTDSFTPSPKFQTTLPMDADERLGKAVNVIGDPIDPILVDVATDTEKLVGFDVK
jgi:hypothetical protein